MGEETSNKLSPDRCLAIIQGQIQGIRRHHRKGGNRLDMVRQIDAVRGALVSVAKCAIEDELGERFDDHPPEPTGERSDQIKQALQLYRYVLES